MVNDNLCPGLRPGKRSGRFNGFLFPAVEDEAVDDFNFGTLNLLNDLGKYGYMIIDSRATTHVANLQSAEDLSLVAKAAGYGNSSFDAGDKKTFGFGNGERGSTTSSAIIPAVLERAGRLKMNIMDADAPPLLGVSLLNKCKAIVDFGDSPGVWFHGLSGPKRPCARLSTGHLALKVIPDAPDMILETLACAGVEAMIEGPR